MARNFRPGPERVRRARAHGARPPLGILVIAAGLLMLGVASICGGVVLLIRGEAVGSWAANAAIAFGPAALYLRSALLRGAGWSWRALLLLLLLLLLSSLVRLLTAPRPRLAPLLEMVIELGCLAYLLRPAVRELFRKGRAPLRAGWGFRRRRRSGRSP